MISRELAIAWVERLGYREVPSPSHRYRRWEREREGKLQVYWIGPRGAVRAGDRVTGSVSVTRRLSAAIDKHPNKFPFHNSKEASPCQPEK